MNEPKKRYRDREQREALLWEYVESGLSQREFCEAEGIAVSTLQYWLRKTREREEEAPEVPQAESPALKLLEVKLEEDVARWPGTPQGRSPAEYQIVVGERRRLVVPSGFVAEEVATLLNLLEGR